MPDNLIDDVLEKAGVKKNPIKDLGNIKIPGVKVPILDGGGEDPGEPASFLDLLEQLAGGLTGNVPGGVFVLQTLKCKVTEGDVFDDDIYMRIRVDGIRQRLPLPMGSVSRAMFAGVPLPDLILGGPLEQAFEDLGDGAAGPWWDMGTGDVQNLNVPITFFDHLTFQLYDHDTIDSDDDKLATEKNGGELKWLLAAHKSGPWTITFKGDGAHYILKGRLVKFADLIPLLNDGDPENLVRGLASSFNIPVPDLPLGSGSDLGLVQDTLADLLDLKFANGKPVGARDGFSRLAFELARTAFAKR